MASTVASKAEEKVGKSWTSAVRVEAPAAVVAKAATDPVKPIVVKGSQVSAADKEDLLNGLRVLLESTKKLGVASGQATVDRITAKLRAAMEYANLIEVE